MERLEAVMTDLSIDIFSYFDACMLTETFITEESRCELKGFYKIYAFASKGDRRRKSGYTTDQNAAQ